MAAGTLSVTNNSKNVTGAGTTFTTQLAAGAFIVLTVGQVAYTVAVASVTNNGNLVLELPFDGPTASGLAWDPIPRSAMALATMGVTVQAQKALRNMIAEAANWSQIFSGQTTVTVTTPNGQQFSGPSWGYMADSMLNKGQNLSDLTDKPAARNALGVGEGQTPNFAGLALSANAVMKSTNGSISPSLVVQAFDSSGQNLLAQGEFRVNANGNLELINRTSGAPRSLLITPEGRIINGAFDNLLDVFGTGSSLRLNAPGADDACYMLARQGGGANAWYCGMGSTFDNNVTLHNYRYNTSMSLRAADIGFTRPIDVTGEVKSSGNVICGGSSVYVRGASGSSNTHLWLQNESGRNRAVLYANDSFSANLRADNGATGAGGATFSLNGATGECRATTFTNTSDERAKFWFKPIANALDKICQLNGKTYSMHPTKVSTVRNAGVIAQDVQKVLPEAVTVGTHTDVLDKNCNPVENPLSLDYNAITALSVEAIKELAANAAADKARISALESELAELKAAVAGLLTK